MRTVIARSIPIIAMLLVACSGADDASGVDATLDTVGAETVPTDPASASTDETFTATPTSPLATEPVPDTVATDAPPTSPQRTVNTEQVSSTEPVPDTSDVAPPDTEVVPFSTDLPQIGVRFEFTDGVIDGPDEIRQGRIVLTIKNNGTTAHALVITSGDSFDELPKRANGLVDVDTLSSFVWSGNIAQGRRTIVNLDLHAGNYVVFDNNIDDDVSHASQGEVRLLTVTE